MNESTVLETWLPIPDYEGLYEVSDLGRVRSLPRPYCRGRILRETSHSRRYLQVGLSQNGVAKTRLIHQLVMEAFVGPCPGGQEIRHLDGTRSNNALTNLTYGTPHENQQDSLRHGTNNNARKTHCIRSHEFTESNTYITPSTGGRICRRCQRDRA